jgi:hypothetical protein
MNAPNDNPAKGLRWWWRYPPRPGMQRLISPWEYRHLRVFGAMRIAGGSVAAAAGVICLWYSAYGWAAFFLVLAAGNLAGGYWYLTIARSATNARRRSSSEAIWLSFPSNFHIWSHSDEDRATAHPRTGVHCHTIIRPPSAR